VASVINGTTAVTLATSQPQKTAQRATIEEVEDEDNMKAKNKETLPANGRYTLMTESEYIEDILRSERGEKLPSKIPKTSKTRVTREEVEKPQPKLKCGKGIDNSNECEPTSSKVKVEK